MRRMNAADRLSEPRSSLRGKAPTHEAVDGFGPALGSGDQG
jgi:hypothetical protein